MTASAIGRKKGKKMKRKNTTNGTATWTTCSIETDEVKKMTRGQIKRAEKRSRFWETVIDYAAAASIFVMGYLLLILLAAIGD